MDFNASVWISIFLHGVLWVFGFLTLARIKYLSRPKHSEIKSSVSVIIPARNEGLRLPALLVSLKQQTRVPNQIIVVDDHSDDNTGDIARSHGAQVVLPPALPDGWLGKPWASHHGAGAASGTILIFLDADVVLEPDGLAKLVDAIENHPGVYSVQPFHDVRKPYEQLSLIFNLIQLLASGAFTWRGTRARKKQLFGPVLAVTKTNYERVGGHAAVKDKVVENYFLSRRFHSQGIPVYCFAGRGAVRFRMYPHGFWELVNGWMKSFGKGASGTSWVLMLGAVGWLTGALGTARHMIMGAFQGDLFRVGIVSFFYFLYVGQIYWLGRRAGRFHFFSSLLYPIPICFFVLVFFGSVFNSIFRRPMNWKGRRLPS